MNTVFKPGLFEGKTAIITGGGTGIGLRIAREMAHLGATVILASRKMENLLNGVEIITSEGGKAYAVECNIRSEESIKKQFVNTGGSIVNIIANMRNGFPIMAHTGAARAGVENITKSLATEWGKYGVRVNAVAPGVIKSSGLDRYDPSYKDFILSFAKNNQTSRLGTEAEVSSAVLFLLCPAASYISGVTLAVDAAESLYSPVMPPVANNANPVFEG